MSRRLAATLGAHAVAVAALVGAPGAVVALAPGRAGLAGGHGADLLAVGAAVAVAAVVVGTRRVRAQAAARPLDAVIAALDALVVLAASATVLPLVVLGAAADAHAALARAGLPVAALWAGTLAAAVALAEGTRAAVYRWLARGPRRGAMAAAAAAATATTATAAPPPPARQHAARAGRAP